VENWPGGLVLAFPRAGAVNGTLVLAEGDINNTFKRYLEKPVTLRIVDDYAEAIEGEGLDADLMRATMQAFNDRNAYASSHVGWGMNSAARWEAMVAYDKRDTNGVEQRAFAGNFLYSTGANPFADRFTLAHFDLPMRNCTILLDNEAVVKAGRLQPPLA
jgi:2,5-dihydroxypyridine 5,6-dioxygenase